VERRLAEQKGAPAAVERALERPAQPLETATRRRFEHRLGVPLGDVRVRTDAASTAELGAAAYTVGSDVVFAPGRYEPGTGRGDRLLGHELAHVLQQRNAAAAPLEVLPPTHPSEREADVGGPTTPLARRAVQRAPAGVPTTIPFVPTVGGTADIIVAEFAEGAFETLYAEEKTSHRLSRALGRFTELAEHPVDLYHFMEGIQLGFLKGVISPVVDVWHMLKAGFELYRRVNEWIVGHAAALFSPTGRANIVAELQAVYVSGWNLEQQLEATIWDAIEHPLDTLKSINALADATVAWVYRKARELGREAAGKILDFLELAWDEMGEKLGYVAGWTTIQVLMLVFSDAIANVIDRAIAIVGKLGKVGEAIVDLIEGAMAAIREIGKLVAAAAKWLFKKLEPLVQAFERLLASAERLFGEALAGLKAAGGRELATAGGAPLEAAADTAKVGATVARDPEAVAALKPAKVHPSNVGKEGADLAPMESRMKDPAAGGGAARELPRVVRDELAHLEKTFPELERMNVRPHYRDFKRVGEFEEAMRTNQTQFSYDVDFEGKTVQLDDIQPDGAIVEVKTRDTGRTMWERETEKWDPAEHTQDVAEEMAAGAHQAEPGTPPWKTKLSKANVEQLRVRLRIASKAKLPCVILHTDTSWYAAAALRSIAENPDLAIAYARRLLKIELMP
jgi:Domain of unknown function (DUF4157)